MTVKDPDVTTVKAALAYYVTGQGDNGKRYREAFAALENLQGRITEPSAAPPYPGFCRTPKVCAGRGSCPADPSCVD